MLYVWQSSFKDKTFRVGFTVLQFGQTKKIICDLTWAGSATNSQSVNALTMFGIFLASHQPHLI
jgi:hypothetical protein